MVVVRAVRGVGIAAEHVQTPTHHGRSGGARTGHPGAADRCDVVLGPHSSLRATASTHMRGAAMSARAGEGQESVPSTAGVAGECAGYGMFSAGVNGKIGGLR